MEFRVYKFLVVPDELFAAEFRESFLTRSSVRVRLARSGAEAVEIGAVWRPHLVIFSSDLPDLDATTFCREIRRAVADGELKLIMVTEKIHEGLDQALRAAPDAHFASPVDDGRLLNTISNMFDIRQRRAPRVATEILARLVETISPSEGAKPGLLANILSLSEIGARLEPARELEVGARGTMTFALPRRDRAISTAYEVKVLLDEILMHVGVDFQAISERDRRAIKQFVETHSAPLSAEGSSAE